MSLVRLRELQAAHRLAGGAHVAELAEAVERLRVVRTRSDEGFSIPTCGKPPR